jgi:uncharacterized protein (DUF427 family)
MWNYTGKERPEFAEEPGAGQESVWDYPRPPALVHCDALVEVKSNHHTIASTLSSLRVLETASPPTYYLPGADIDWSQLVETAYHSYCEWKGEATYWALASDPTATVVAWSYENPSERFSEIDGCVSFYPGRIDCLVNSERVTPQPGDFYGGWVTKSIAGPVKGTPGTNHW